MSGTLCLAIVLLLAGCGGGVSNGDGKNSPPTSATAPSITLQPQSQSVIAGQTATFSVAANGTGPLSYQWKNNGANISGATSTSYTTTATMADNGATFSVTVSNSAGNVTSNAATLTVSAGGAQTARFAHPNSPNPPAIFPSAWDLPSTSDFTPSIVAHRTSGIAPLYVHFDGINSLPQVNGDVDIQATYIWNFDTTGVDANTAYDRVSGFVAGHVFNEPGTYTVRLDVFDRNGRHGHTTQQIQVLPFTGTTYYVSTAGNDTNAGTMQAPFKTAQHALTQLGSYANVRILFRNGDRFDLSGLNLGGVGPTIVSGYSDPNQLSNALPELHSTDVNGTWFVLGVASSDWRLVGVKITSGGHTSGSAGPRYPSGINVTGTDVLVSRCDLTELDSGFNAGGSSSGAMAFYENEIHVISEYGIYIAGDAQPRLSFIGNYIHDFQSDAAQHGYRMQAGDRFFLGFNVIEANGTKSGVQLRGMTSRTVVYANVLDRASGAHAQNGSATPHEEQHHVVFDGNVFVGRRDPAYTNGFTVRQDALDVGAHDIMVRNNLFHDYANAVAVVDDSGGAGNNWRGDRIYIHNNSVFCPNPDPNGDPPGCTFLTSQGLGLSIYGNLQLNLETSTSQYDHFLNPSLNGTSDYSQMFGTVWSVSTALFGSSTLAQWQGAGHDTHSLFANPEISVTNVTDVGYGMPSASSQGIDHGPATSLTGNWADIRGRIRDALPDTGAFERLP